MNFNKLLLFFAAFQFMAFSALSQDEELASLSGSITDALSGEPLIGANIVLVGTYKGSAADYNGNYVINGIKAKDYSVKVGFIGYETKIYTGISFSAGESKVLNITLKEQSQSLNEVTVVGKKGQVNLEAAASEVSIGQEEISKMNVRDVQEVLGMQAGVVKTQDGLQIRGARVYETEYIVDGISAQDPLAGTGFGVDVSSSSVSSIDLITGGVGAEFGGGSSGVVNTKIREGGEKFQISGSYQRDNLGNSGIATSFNTDRVELNIGTPIPGTKNKLTLFASGSAIFSDGYFGPVANQLNSSLFSANPEFWAPRFSNSYTNTFKLAYKLASGTKLTITNQHSLNINQNTRTLQIVGFDAILTPGFQYNRSNNLDNATTYTHHSNLTALNLNHLINKNWGLNFSVGRLFTNLRADANGRPFRTETVDQILDEDHIVSYPIDIFNPNDPRGIYYVSVGNGLVNNGGISSTWHDHYAEEYTFNAKATYIPNQSNELSFGIQNTFTEYQWVDVTRPWVGAPIRINDSTTTQSVSIGSSNDIWKVNPVESAIFVQNRISYKGIIATLGLRMNFWAPGKFTDDAVADPTAPVIDQVRADYLDKTTEIFGLRWKARLLPKINVSFPVTENNVLYFNYGHSMRLPHPRFVYAGLDPTYQDRSFLSSLGNPDLDPEVNVSYEIGLKSKITRDIGLTVTAFNNNRFDYIVSRRVIVTDQTGRPTTKNFYINQDYANIYGVELGLNMRIARYLTTFSNVAYQVARGKSNSARESALQIEQNGQVSLSSEQFLAFDRPWNINLGIIFAPDSTLPIFGVDFTGFSAFLSYQFTSGFRYTPQRLISTNELGRPIYEEIVDQYLQEKANPWNNFDLKLSYNIPLGLKKGKGVSISMEIRNLTNAKNSQIINPVTGRAYEFGDDVPITWRDPRYNGPQEAGVDPRNPARYLAPRQILYGLEFRF
ncbi:MAG: TonB-dependent receptor [Bacteroidetes bacterium]|nr:MAG: TonB-dependent receptor [Bacteroidota bacterium]